jgi:CRISPR/Cas system CSM-associated protein Csm3 (group 7 of RAMP superfamily)
MKPQRLDLEYHIVWQGRWHVGSGYKSAATNRLLQRMGGVDGSPFVPGSQIKGVLRHQCERFAFALGLEAVNPHDGIKEDNKKLVKHFKPLVESSLVVDRLFGSRYQGECLFVTNAEPVSSEENTVTSVQPRTALDRVTGTVMEQHLFTTEFAEGGANLQGIIRARHPAGVLTQEGNGFPYEYALLLAALLSLDTLGGDKSVGLGRCEIRLKEETLCWNSQHISSDEAFQSFKDEPEEWGALLEMLREESSE